MKAHWNDPRDENDRVIKTSAIVREWLEIAKNTGGLSANPYTFTVMDSYYLDSVGRDYVVAGNHKAIAGVQLQRFKSKVRATADEPLKLPGSWAAVHNSATNELIVKMHEIRYVKDPIRYVYTTAFEHRDVSTSSVIDNITKIIPGYTLYGKTYSVCDHFNKNLHDRT